MKIVDLYNSTVADAVSAVAGVLRTPGSVAAVPTETVYGLVSALNAEGSERIYALKRRSGAKRLGWFVGNWRRLAEYGVELTPLVVRLALRYTPGPVTIIAPDVSGNGIGFRVPDHPFLAALLAEMETPLYQTSANLSGEPDALSLDDALAHLDGQVDISVNGGDLPPAALASTVVDARGEVPKILRQGALKIDPADF